MERMQNFCAYSSIPNVLSPEQWIVLKMVYCFGIQLVLTLIMGIFEEAAAAKSFAYRIIEVRGCLRISEGRLPYGTQSTLSEVIAHWLLF